MKYYILASGSKGNASVFVGPDTTILIDLGLSLREFKKRLSVFDLDEKNIFATLFTHRHSDHVNGNYAAIAGHNLYAPAETLPETAIFNLVVPYQSFQINEFNITPLPTSHDVPNSVGYVMKVGAFKVVLMTDTGYISSKNLAYMKNADLYIFEANHNERLLLGTNRPFSVIQRIISDTGHLSNEACGHYLAELIGPNTKEIILAHLSTDANSSDIAIETVDKIIRKYRVDQSNLKLRAAGQYIPIWGDLNDN